MICGLFRKDIILADVHDTVTRSYNMSRIKGCNTKPEEKVRKYLFSKGFRYRKNDKSLPGKPDIVLPKYKAVVFINGCFWHKHEGCKYFKWPRSNADFWKNKINRNVERDKQVQHELMKAGWKVITVWECELKKELFEQTMVQLIDSIKNS